MCVNFVIIVGDIILFCMFQALELQKIDGLSVYNQETFEAAVFQQVDDAFEQRIGHLNNIQIESDRFIDKGYDSGNVEEMGEQKLEDEKEEDDDEMEMDQRIRLGEMTPFGTTLMVDKNADRYCFINYRFI